MNDERYRQYLRVVCAGLIWSFPARPKESIRPCPQKGLCGSTQPADGERDSFFEYDENRREIQTDRTRLQRKIHLLMEKKHRGMISPELSAMTDEEYTAHIIRLHEQARRESGA